MKKGLKILLLFFSSFSSYIFAQEITKEKFFKPDGVILGFDVSKFLIKALQPERTEYEASVDIALNKNFFIVGEGGYTNYDYHGGNYLYNYSSEGQFWRAGFCYNFLKKRENSDLVTLGLLYGRSTFDHFASGLTINDRLYGQLNIGDLTFTGQHANWLEPYFSIKVELFTNIFLGWSIRGKVYFGGSNFDLLKPNVLPGFGKFNNNTNASLTYTIYYRIPF